MLKKLPLCIAVTFFAGACHSVPTTAVAPANADRPNVVVIFTDDQGWADIGTQGAVGFETPHLDRLAAEGTRFTNFYVAQPVCSASRMAAPGSGCASGAMHVPMHVQTTSAGQL